MPLTGGRAVPVIALLSGLLLVSIGSDFSPVLSSSATLPLPPSHLCTLFLILPVILLSFRSTTRCCILHPAAVCLVLHYDILPHMCISFRSTAGTVLTATINGTLPAQPAPLFQIHVHEPIPCISFLATCWRPCSTKTTAHYIPHAFPPIWLFSAHCIALAPSPTCRFTSAPVVADPDRGHGTTPGVRDIPIWREHEALVPCSSPHRVT